MIVLGDMHAAKQVNFFSYPHKVQQSDKHCVAPNATLSGHHPKPAKHKWPQRSEIAQKGSRSDPEKAKGAGMKVVRPSARCSQNIAF